MPIDDDPFLSLGVLARCKRRWSYNYIATAFVPPYPSVILGEKVHASLEARLNAVTPEEGTD